MKKLTSLLCVVSLSSAAVAGPVQKEQIKSQEAVKLVQAQAQSQKALQVQAGSFSDDYGVATIAAIFGVAALAVGIVALAND